MKIALIAPTYLPARRANTIQVMKMAQAIARRGNEVLVFVPDSRTKKAIVPAERSWELLMEHYGIKETFPIEWIRIVPALRRYDFGYTSVRRARKWGADIVYTRLPQAAVYSRYIGLKTVFELHDFPMGHGSERLFRWYLKGKGAARLVVITHMLHNDLKAAFELPPFHFTIVASDGIDLERYEHILQPKEARERLNQLHPEIQLNDAKFTVGYTGHLYRGRGIEMIINLAQRLPAIQFLLIGGEPKDVLRAQALMDQLKDKNLVVTGFVPNAQLPLYQAACDALLMPYQVKVSASSGGDIGKYLSPMKLFEYMASERVILSSDLPVLREVLNPENAILLPPDELDAWYKAILYIKNHPNLAKKLSTQARRDVEKYTWDVRVKRIFEDLSDEI